MMPSAPGQEQAKMWQGNVKVIVHIMIDQRLPRVKTQALSIHDLSLRLVRLGVRI